MQSQSQVVPPPAREQGSGLGTTVIELPGGGRIVVPGGVTAQGAYQAARAKREVVSDLLQRARTRRNNAADELRNAQPGADRVGIEKRIEGLDQRIFDLEKQQVEVEGEMIALRSIPGVTDRPTMPPRPPSNSPPEAAIIAGTVLTVLFVLCPIAFAYARRIWKRTGTAAAALPQAVMERFTRLEQNVDTMAIEIERISEGQRFMTKLFSEQGARAGQLRESAPPAELGLTTSAPRP